MTTTDILITCQACGERELVPGQFPRSGRYGERLAQCNVCGGLTEVLDLVGIVEIARRSGVTKDAIHKWRDRYPDFPAPEAVLTATPVWRWESVRRWLDATGRAK